MAKCDCEACKSFDRPAPVRPWRGDPPKPPTVRECVDGMFENVRAAAQAVAKSVDIEDANGPGSLAGQHAAAYRRRFKAEQRQAEAEKKRWQSFLDAHPELADESIHVRCQHGKQPGHPTCYDGHTQTFSREVGWDDGDEAPTAPDRRLPPEHDADATP